MHKCLTVCVVSAFFAFACGGKLAAAPTPQLPNVVGNYSGSTTITFPEIGQTLSCPTTSSVT